MKIKRLKGIPLPASFKGVTIGNTLYIRENAKFTETGLRHEEIHTKQWKELIYIFFPIWYAIEWTIRLFAFKGAHNAYRNISFEREAYEHQADPDYIITRERFAFIKYIRKKAQTNF